MSGWRDLAANILDGEPPAQKAPPPALSGDSLSLGDGLAKLKGMRRPRVAEPERWAAIIKDAEELLRRWGDKLEQCGWTEADLFGFDLSGDDWRMGLVFAIRRGRLILVSGVSATILNPDGYWRHIHYRKEGQPAPIWAQGPRA